MHKKWIAILPPYIAVWAGLFFFHSAWGALLGFHLAILLVLIFLRPALPLNLFFNPARPSHVLVSLLICASSGVGLYFLWNVFAVAKDLSVQLAELGLKPSTWVGFIAYFTLVNPFFEEYFWRGVLGSDTRTLFIGDLLYAGYHIMVVWNKTYPLSMLFMVLILTLAGWLWRQVYRRDGSLLAPVLGHMVADLSILLAVYFRVS